MFSNKHLLRNTLIPLLASANVTSDVSPVRTALWIHSDGAHALGHQMMTHVRMVGEYWTGGASEAAPWHVVDSNFYSSPEMLDIRVEQLNEGVWCSAREDLVSSVAARFSSLCASALSVSSPKPKLHEAIPPGAPSVLCHHPPAGRPLYGGEADQEPGAPGSGLPRVVSRKLRRLIKY